MLGSAEDNSERTRQLGGQSEPEGLGTLELTSGECCGPYGCRRSEEPRVLRTQDLTSENYP